VPIPFSPEIFPFESNFGRESLLIPVLKSGYSGKDILLYVIVSSYILFPFESNFGRESLLIPVLKSGYSGKDILLYVIVSPSFYYC